MVLFFFFCFLTVSIAWTCWVWWKGLMRDRSQTGRKVKTHTRKKKCPNTLLFVTDSESVNPWHQTQSKHANNIDHICTCCLSLTVTESFITSSYSMRSAACAFCWCKNLANIPASYLSFRLWPFDKLVAALWVMSVACQCSSFDGPRLVGYLITLFWQLNLSLRCSAPEKY